MLYSRQQPVGTWALSIPQNSGQDGSNNVWSAVLFPFLCDVPIHKVKTNILMAFSSQTRAGNFGRGHQVHQVHQGLVDNALQKAAQVMVYTGVGDPRILQKYKQQDPPPSPPTSSPGRGGGIYDGDTSNNIKNTEAQGPGRVAVP
eukprot:1017028-Ditylum_brightwellii.AAC.1